MGALKQLALEDKAHLQECLKKAEERGDKDAAAFFKEALTQCEATIDSPAFAHAESLMSLFSGKKNPHA